MKGIVRSRFDIMKLNKKKSYKRHQILLKAFHHKAFIHDDGQALKKDWEAIGKDMIKYIK